MAFIRFMCHWLANLTARFNQYMLEFIIGRASETETETDRMSDGGLRCVYI